MHKVCSRFVALCQDLNPLLGMWSRWAVAGKAVNDRERNFTKNRLTTRIAADRADRMKELIGVPIPAPKVALARTGYRDAQTKLGRLSNDPSLDDRGHAAVDVDGRAGDIGAC